MWNSSTARPPLWASLALLSIALTGCGHLPDAPSAPPQRVSSSESTCKPCAQQAREMERSRIELAIRDAELRELRTNQRDQVKALQDSKREVTRAKVKLRRLATQADAASYIAEVEVAMATLRSSTGAKSRDPRIAQAQRLLESADAPFTQADYGAAMDRAAQAEQLISAVDAEMHAPPRTKLALRPQAKPLAKTTTAAKPGPPAKRVATLRPALDCDRRASLRTAPDRPAQALPRDSRPLLDCPRLPG